MTTERKIVLASVVLAICLWVADVLLALGFAPDDRLESASSMGGICHHLVDRVLTAVIVIGSGLLMALFVRKHRIAEGRYQELVETSQDLIWRCDEEGRFTYLNPAWEQTHGYSLSEMIGKPFTEFQTQGTAAPAFEEFSRHLEGGSVTGYETTHVRKDGQLVHLVFNASPLRDATGKIVGAQGTALDITDRRQVEDALRESEARYRAVVETSLAGIAIVDKHESLTFANSCFAEMLGYSVGEILGMNLSQISAPGEFLQHQGRTEERESGVSSIYETVVQRKDGTLLNVLVSASPMSMAAGDFQGTLGVVVDITDRKQAEASLLQSSRLISLGEMAAGLGHELNQPLTVVSALAQRQQLRLEQGKEVTPELQLDWCRDILEQVERMSGLVEHLRLFSRNHFGEDMESVEINDIVRGALAMTGAQMRSQGVELQLDLAVDLPPIMGSRYRLEEVLLNLVGNARDALQERWDRLTAAQRADFSMELAIRTRLEDDSVVVEVEDNGAGMTDETRQQLFEPFFTTKSPDKGTGLGLSISFAIVKDHDGTIECESQEGEGTIFRVRLPLLER